MVKIVGRYGRRLRSVTIYLQKSDTDAIEMLRRAVDNVSDPEVSTVFVHLEGERTSFRRRLARLFAE